MSTFASILEANDMNDPDVWVVSVNRIHSGQPVRIDHGAYQLYLSDDDVRAILAGVKRTTGIGECRHEELVETIRTWSQAYPLDVFPEPDWDTIDPGLRTVVSAGMGRHVIGRLMELIGGSDG